MRASTVVSTDAPTQIPITPPKRLRIPSGWRRISITSKMVHEMSIKGDLLNREQRRFVIVHPSGGSEIELHGDRLVAEMEQVSYVRHLSSHPDLYLVSLTQRSTWRL